MDITEQIEDFITPMLFKTDENIFGRMANFIMNLDPDDLTTDQIEIVMGIIEDMEAQDDMEESLLKSKKATISHNRYSKKYYRLNKDKVKDKKEKFDKAMKNKKEVMATSGRTITGRKKTRYNSKEHTN